MPSRNRCGRCGEQGAANRSRGHASREAARQGKLHKRSAEAPAIDARSGQASESTNEANDARGCSEVRRMATPTSGPPLVCAKAPSPFSAGCPAAPGQGAPHVMLHAFFANAVFLGDLDRKSDW